MSQQAGILHFDQRPVSPDQVTDFDRGIAQQGPDRRGEYQEPGLAMLFRAFDITEEDARESQPIHTAQGDVVTWDGRLDNRAELLALLGKSARELPTDAEIVTAALTAFEIKTLPQLMGDWALTWWNSRTRRLVLARDYIGSRTLYYSHSEKRCYWSTSLAALILHSGENYSLCDAYFAGYLVSNPEAHLTPYAEIVQVPPGAYVEITPRNVRTVRYWSFNSLPDIRYRSDEEYEEHFRERFRTSVQRRLRTNFPVVAELSGGLDSSAIVCMAHDILNRGESRATINTVSYYSFGDPGCDERPYFEAVERFIGKLGTHLEEHTAAAGTGLRPMRDSWFNPMPSYFDRVIDGERCFLDAISHQAGRIRFSGIGGDELLGGVQDPIPDLARLLWECRLQTFARQICVWALQRKTTIWALGGKSIAYLTPIWIREHLDAGPMGRVKWMLPEFARQQHIARRRLRPSGGWREWLPGPPSPDSVYLSLAASIAGYLPRFTFVEQKVLPFYDRDLVQFLLTIPGEQLLRPTHRRSLMRRALKGLVPEVVLQRKTKALGRRLPALELMKVTDSFLATLENTPIAARYISLSEVDAALHQMGHGQEFPSILLERLLGAAYLCHSLATRGLLKTAAARPLSVRAVCGEAHQS